MNTIKTIECVELNRPDPLILAAARELYERSLEPCERIPWEWIERAIWTKATGSSGSWNRHLLVATDSSNPREVLGYLVATYFPGFGGYVSYMGVDDRARGRGVGTRLYEAGIEIMNRDAELVDESLPFVVWESQVPVHDNERTNWIARTKLFDRIGAYWMDGIELWAPNYDAGYGTVPYQVFVKPVNESAQSFTPGRLRQVIHDHYRRVYKQRPGDECYDRTFAVHPKPRLRPARQAGDCLDLLMLHTR